MAEHDEEMKKFDDDVKKFEEDLKKPKVSGVKKDRIVTCPGCGKKQTMPQVAFGDQVTCRKCTVSFELLKEMAEDAHMVTMEMVNLQVKQMDRLQKAGAVAPPPSKKITMAKRVAEKSFVVPAIVTLILYAVWPVGFIVNIVFLLKARKYREAAGKPGKCAFLLLIWFIVLGILTLVATVVIVVLSLVELIELGSSSAAIIQ